MTNINTSPDTSTDASLDVSQDVLCLEASERHVRETFTHPVTREPIVFPDNLTPAQTLAPVPVFEHGYEPISFNGLVPLDVILDRVFPAYGGATLCESFGMLLASPSERATVELLVQELSTQTLHESGSDGHVYFREPVIITENVPDWDDICDTLDEPASWVEPRPQVPTMWAANVPVYTVGNGMHRLCATWLTGASHVLCTDHYPDSSISPETEYVEVRLTIPAAIIEAHGEPVPTVDGTHWEWNALDHALGWLRSFPLKNHAWIEGMFFASEHIKTDNPDGTGAASGDDVIRVLYDCSHHHQQLLLDAINQRVPGVRILDVTALTEADLDD